MLAMKNYFAQGAGVFRVTGDCAFPERLPENNRAAHAGAEFGGEAGLRHRSFGDFGQHVGFGELLGANEHRTRLRRGRRRSTSEQNASEQDQRFHSTGSPCWALMNSETKLSAGWSRRAAKVPTWTTCPCRSRTI